MLGLRLDLGVFKVVEKGETVIGSGNERRS